MDDDALRTVRARWAVVLDCDPSVVLSDGATVTAWGDRAVECLVWEGGAVVAAPGALVSPLRDRARQVALGIDIDSDDVLSLVDPVATPETVLGPQFVGYCDQSTFVPVDGDARRVDPSRLDALRAACPVEEWDRSGVRSGDPDRPTFAVFRDGRAIAAAQYGTASGVAGVATISHPDHRGRGHATAAVSRAVAHALEAGLLPEYRTVERWSSSVALARRLGFQRVARSLLVPLADGGRTP